VEPGRDASTGLIGIRILPRSKKGLLSHVFGFGVVAEDSLSEGHDHLEIVLRELTEGAGVSAGYALHERLVFKDGISHWVLGGAELLLGPQNRWKERIPSLDEGSPFWSRSQRENNFAAAG
jgi:hypothetical protein